jgi:hypothetical protein
MGSIFGFGGCLLAILPAPIDASACPPSGWMPIAVALLSEFPENEDG